MAWLFRDFVNNRGENEIHTWLHSIPPEARAHINTLINLLQVADVNVFDRAHHVGLLGGSCEGLIELIVHVKRVQYRPIGCYGPGQRVVTLLAGAREVGNQLVPRGVCNAALAKESLVGANQRRYSCEHDFS